MTKPISWRPSEAALAALERLEARTGKKRSKLLDALVIAAERGPEIVADNDRAHGNRPSAPVARSRLRYNSTADIDTAKMAVFQERTGMTHFGKKR